MKVKKVEILNESATFYDLKVNGTHNYFVTDKHINVHNSGKSYVTKNTTRGLNLKLINSDDAFESGIRKAQMSFDINSMSPEDYAKAMEIRDRAKSLTKMKQGLAIQGRLGLVIDGTGKDFEKIKKQSEQLRNIGYDTYMIFVNTSLDTALERNQMRDRKVPENIVQASWQEVQSNMGKFQNYFGQSNFIVVDNNDADEDVLTKVFKRISKYVDNPVKNYKAQKWIETELKAKRRS